MVSPRGGLSCPQTDRDFGCSLMWTNSENVQNTAGFSLSDRVKLTELKGTKNRADQPEEPQEHLDAFTHGDARPKRLHRVCDRKKQTAAAFTQKPSVTINKDLNRTSF